MEGHITEVFSVAGSSNRKFKTILDDIKFNIRLAITRQDLRRIVVLV